MKKRIFIVVCMLVALSSPAFAGQKFVDDFLKHYKPSEIDSKPTPAEMAPDTLPAMVRNGEIPLSVSDVIALTLKNNLDIGVNGLAPLSSRLAIDTFYRPFDPALRISTTVSRNTSPSSNALSGASSITQLNTIYDIGFSKPTQGGTTLGIDFLMNRASSNSVFNTFNPAWTGAVKYSATQHFLKDFGKTVNTHQLTVAKTNLDISDVQFERQVIDIVTQAEKSYWDLVFTFEDLKVKQGSMALAQKTLSDNRIQVDAGALASADLVQAESEVATRQQQLLDANFTQVLVSDQVKKLVTNGPDPGLVLAKISPTQAAPSPRPGDILSMEEAVAAALENRPEMREIDLQLKNNDVDILYSKNQLLPSLDVTASYTQNGLGGPQTLRDGFGVGASIVAVVPGGITDALSQIARNTYRGYNFQVTLNIPLSNKASQADYSRAVTEKRTSQNRKAATAAAIALEVRNAVTQVQMSSARIDAAQKIRELAERKLDYEQRKFNLGASTIRFVIEEQRNVTQAQTDEIAALVSYAKALVDYDHAIGVTLQKSNIVLDKN
jgi:outer membrane protein